MRCFVAVLLAFLTLPLVATAADGNRLAYLDSDDPYYPSRTFAKLTTPQWVGEAGVEAVVVLAIDDMRGHQKWEEFLRPVLERLKQIDGRAPVSIMTCAIDPHEPHLQKWIAEGVSLEVHTSDHPCPCLQAGDFAKAKSTYERCVDLLASVPGNRPVAFRMPCCDSLNTCSPRFWNEIFNRRTGSGRFLTLDSSVFNITTPNDPELPRELVLDEQGRDIFRHYVPFKSFVNTIEDYPYPYVINRLCWEFPCAVPSDWQAQNVQKSNNPQTVLDMQRSLDAAVVKQGVFNLVFHPHGWIRNDQIVAIIDHAVARHGSKVKFLTFREAQERLDKNLLDGQPLRDATGDDNGVRILDLNHDGYMDVVCHNAEVSTTKVWSPSDRTWIRSGSPLPKLANTKSAPPAAALHFGVMHDHGRATVMLHTADTHVAATWSGDAWNAAEASLAKLPTVGKQSPALAYHDGLDMGLRLRDLDGDGICECLVGNLAQHAVFRWHPGKHQWQETTRKLPAGAQFVDHQGRDAGLRLVDVDEDGRLDVLYSNARGYGLFLYDAQDASGWREVLAGDRGDSAALPLIVRDGTSNGAWFHSRHLWVQNEDTSRLADLVERRSFDDMLKQLQPGPKSPQASLAALKPRAGFQVEQMAAEPLVMDPIAFAWGPDGRLWVVEMGDYPSGVDGNGKPGGIVRYLEDSDGDGRYDRSQVFLSGLGFPTGVAPWRGGVLVTCAPEIFYAEDTDGDGRADHRQVLFSGFGEGNQQHRLNGLKWGLDGWLYCANGDSGGQIKSHKTEIVTDISGRDFRIRPDEGLIEALAGQSQFGRNRDDFGNWFGCNNANPMYHFALQDSYLRRNPHIAAIDGRVDLSDAPGAAPVYPRSRTLPRFNDLHTANRFTSANSAMVYRDDLFGEAFSSSTFVSEPVHNLVHREVLSSAGLTFFSRRADDERESEFLASSDNWFRPTMLQTGPDGALWVADMYRHVIEHPEWIPKQWQQQLDLRAGHDMGRLYRVYPVGKKPRTIARLDKLPVGELAAAMDSPSGWQRDMVQQMLTWRKHHAAEAQAAAGPLGRVAENSQHPAARLQALYTLDQIGKLEAHSLLKAIGDKDARVRQHAVRLSEPRLAKSRELADAMIRLANDDDLGGQLQRAYSLGQWNDPRSGAALASIALRFPDERFIQAAVLSSVRSDNLEPMLSALLASRGEGGPPLALVERLVGLTVSMNAPQALASSLKHISQGERSPQGLQFATWQLNALAGLLDAFDRRQQSWEKIDGAASAIGPVIDFARQVVGDANADDERRALCVRLLGRSLADRQADVQTLRKLFTPQTSGMVQLAAVAALARGGAPDNTPEVMLSDWKSHGPAVRTAVLDAMLARPIWTEAVLEKIEQHLVPAADIDAAHRQRLLTLRNPDWRARAEKLFLGTGSGDRAKVVAAHQHVIDLVGDAEAGAAVFAKRCSACHQLRGAGHPVGPDLMALSDNSPQFMLTAILDPNRAVETKFVDYLAVTTAGLSFTGILINETGNSVTLLGQEGKQQTLLRSELEQLQSTGKSLMPEGIERDVSAVDLANLIAYIRAAGPPRKKFPANQPQVVSADTSGSLQLLATHAEIYGESLILESSYKNLGFWQSENDRAVWQVDVPAAGKYAVKLQYACDDSTAGNQLVLESGSRTLRWKVSGTGGWDNYVPQEIGVLELPAGKQQVLIRASGPISSSLLDLERVVLEPKQ